MVGEPLRACERPTNDALAGGKTALPTRPHSGKD